MAGTFCPNSSLSQIFGFNSLLEECQAVLSELMENRTRVSATMEPILNAHSYAISTLTISSQVASLSLASAKGYVPRSERKFHYLTEQLSSNSADIVGHIENWFSKASVHVNFPCIQVGMYETYIIQETFLYCIRNAISPFRYLYSDITYAKLWILG